MLHTVGLVARVDRKKALDLAARLSNHLEKKGLTVFLEPTLSKHAKRPDASTSLEKMKTDLIITVGGDGTILNTCLQIPKPEPPILAINMGVRGFLAEATPKEAVAAVDKCLRGDFTLERCSKLASFIGKTRLPDALNEVFITSLAPAKLLHMRIWKNGVSVADCRSDGAVIASQVGSTGYSLSAGGPVLDPDLDAFVFTPICPLTIFHPIVFSTKSSISVELRNPKRALVVLDGHYKTEIIPKEARIVVVKSEHQSAFVRFNEDFYRRLKGRLLFSRGVGS
ncbi:MAG: NAD(+)/NADH kinase [Candidatus Bathyarchaeota archaeon]|nr:MAG: NAD(+)/NADH kinase [Candidatus Bathyarchaeota archaeon]UCD40242.1 MAG: NAD(+)/NADH kinase [Candidatus Bathyarchaeota archaeon]